MSPDKLVDENDPSTLVAKTKVAPVKFTKRFLFSIFLEGLSYRESIVIMIYPAGQVEVSFRCGF